MSSPHNLNVAQSSIYNPPTPTCVINGSFHDHGVGLLKVLKSPSTHSQGILNNTTLSTKDFKKKQQKKKHFTVPCE